MLIVTCTFFHSSYANLLSTDLIRYSKEENDNLPRMVGDMIRMDSVESRGNTLHYFYTDIDEKSRGAITGQWNIENKLGVIDYACKDEFVKNILSSGVDINLTYRDLDKNEISTILIDNYQCNKIKGITKKLKFDPFDESKTANDYTREQTDLLIKTFLPEWQKELPITSNKDDWIRTNESLTYNNFTLTYHVEVPIYNANVEIKIKEIKKERIVEMCNYWGVEYFKNPDISLVYIYKNVTSGHIATQTFRPSTHCQE